MAVGVFSSNLAILSMNQEFRVLIFGDASPNVNGFFLSCCSDSCPRITGTLDLPATFGVRSNMLILPHINTPPIHKAGSAGCHLTVVSTYLYFRNSKESHRPV